MHVIASVATYDQLRDALRERRLELGLTQPELDYLSGVQDGWTGKAECSAKRYGNLRSDESSRPQIAAAINAPSSGSDAPFADIRRVVGRLMVYMRDHGAVISIQVRASRDSHRVVHESNREARRDAASQTAASTTTLGFGYDRESVFSLN